MIEALQDNIIRPNTTKLVDVDARSRMKGEITFRDVAVLYGQRPHDDRLWYLSPYEFVSEWEVKLLSYPRTLGESSDPHHHADVAHGQSLVWSGPNTGIQGVTELETCERTKDVWLTKVQREFCNGTLLEESRAFLHGYPMMKLGSTVDGIARCQSQRVANVFLKQLSICSSMKFCKTKKDHANCM